MKPSFRAVSIVACIICFLLGAVWMFAPQAILATWSVSFSDPVGLVSRRCAAMFLGIGIVLYRSRNVSEPMARNSLALGLAVSCLVLAGLGVFELVAGHAGNGILPAAIVEVLLASAFILAVRTPETQSYRPD